MNEGMAHHHLNLILILIALHPGRELGERATLAEIREAKENNPLYQNITKAERKEAIDGLLAYREDKNTWNTCDLDGGNVKLVGDGLPRFNFPTLSPDGKQLIMMKFGEAAGPQPNLVDLDTGAAKPMELGPGMWATPAWR